MKRILKQMVNRRAPIGRIVFPLGGTLVSLVVVALTVGQAVGPVLSGSATGSVSVTVEQGLVLDLNYGMNANPVFSTSVGFDPDDSVTTRTVDGTQFTVAGELNVGERAVLNVFLQNNDQEDSAAIVELSIPAGIDVDIEEIVGFGGDVQAARLDRNRWLLFVDDDAGNPAAASGSSEALANDGIAMTIRPKADLNPGFYSIGFTLIQIRG